MNLTKQQLDAVVNKIIEAVDVQKKKERTAFEKTIKVKLTTKEAQKALKEALEEKKRQEIRKFESKFPPTGYYGKQKLREQLILKTVDAADLDSLTKSMSKELGIKI